MMMPASETPTDEGMDMPDYAEIAEAAAFEAARKLFAGQIDFLKGVVDVAGLPSPDRPEFAFSGRSNVGKSSLINAVTGRKALARTSNTPGRTRELNFFEVGDVLRIVDLPGYGYAEAPKKVAQRWSALARDYLKGRINLSRVFVLIDARHGVKPSDEDMFTELDKAAVSYQGVLTKADKVKSGALEQVMQQTREKLAKHPAAFPGVVVTSSVGGEGIDELRNLIHAQAVDRPL